MNFPYIAYYTIPEAWPGDNPWGVGEHTVVKGDHAYYATECVLLIPTWEAYEAAS